jgi:chromosomal replication initiator protein
MDVQSQTSPEKGWGDCKTSLLERLGEEIFSSWFKQLNLAGLDKETLFLTVPTAFLRQHIQQYYPQKILDCWPSNAPTVTRVHISVRQNGQAMAQTDSVPLPRVRAISSSIGRPADKGESGPNPLPQVTDGSPLDPIYTFASFVETASNRVALAAARTVAEPTAERLQINPLYVQADIGLGKTHLLQSIATGYLEHQPQARVIYMTAEQLLMQIGVVTRQDMSSSLTERLCGCDLLLLDDFQFLLKSEALQREVRHLISTRLGQGKQVVVAGDRRPNEIDHLDKHLRSRLENGMVVELGTIDSATRMTILKQWLTKAQAEDQSLKTIPVEALEVVAQTPFSNGRQLRSVFNKIIFAYPLETLLSAERLEQLIGTVHRPGQPPRISIEDIQRMAARHYNISRSELLSSRRTRIIVKPRQVAMYLSKLMTPRSLPEIGRRFGGRDHTTVLHAVRKIEGLCARDTGMADEVELLRRLINARAS